MLNELKISFTTVLVLFCDNIGASMLVKHLIVHSRIKHVEVYFYSIREIVLSGELDVEYTLSEEQLAYIMIVPWNNTL